MVQKYYKLPIGGCIIVNSENNLLGEEGNDVTPLGIKSFLNYYPNKDESFAFFCYPILYDFDDQICIVEITCSEEIHNEFNSWLGQKEIEELLIEENKLSFVINNPDNITTTNLIICKTPDDLSSIKSDFEHLLSESCKEKLNAIVQ